MYRSLVESLPMAVLRKDLQGRICHVNSRACDALGRTAEALVGKTDFDLFPADLAKKYADDDADVIASRRLYHTVERHVGLDEQTHHVEVWKSPVHDAGGSVVGTQAVFWDISEAKDAENEKKFEAFLLETLLNYLPDCIYFKDTESRFVRVSRSMAGKMGVESPQATIGRTDADFFIGAHAGEALADEREILKTGKSVLNQVESEYFPDGRVEYVSTSKMPLRDDRGKLIGTFGISRDITGADRGGTAVVGGTRFDADHRRQHPFVYLCEGSCGAVSNR